MYCPVVPAPVTANVPAVVIGLPVTAKALGIVKSTEVTVPKLVGNTCKAPVPST